MQDLTKILSIGDVVYNHAYGRGEVSSISPDENNNFPIKVVYIKNDGKTLFLKYTKHGKIFEGHKPVLSSEPWPDAKPFPEKKFHKAFLGDILLIDGRMSRDYFLVARIKEGFARCISITDGRHFYDAEIDDCDVVKIDMIENGIKSIKHTHTTKFE